MKGICNRFIHTGFGLPGRNTVIIDNGTRYHRRVAYRLQFLAKSKLFRGLKILYTVYKTLFSVKKNVKTLIREGGSGVGKA